MAFTVLSSPVITFWPSLMAAMCPQSIVVDRQIMDLLALDSKKQVCISRRADLRSDVSHELKQSTKRDQKPLITRWAFHFKLEIMIDVLYMGFPLELYTLHEYSYIYWYVLIHVCDG